MITGWNRFLLIIFASLSSAASAQNICAPRLRTHVQSWIAHSQSRSWQAEIVNLAQQAPLLLVGEVHRNQPGMLKVLVQILEPLLKKSQKNCLLIESPSSYGNLENHISKYSGQPNYQHVVKERRAALAIAQKAGLKTHLVDLKVNAFDESLDILNQRDLHMAQIITALFQQKKCDRALMMIGRAHLTSEQTSRRSLSHFLRGQGIAHRKMQLVDSNDQLEVKSCGPEMGVLVNWSGVCQGGNRLPTVSSPVFLSHSVDFLSGLRLFPLDPQDQSRWLDFDGTLLLPHSGFPSSKKPLPVHCG